METKNCIRLMLEQSGMSGRQLSAELGKVPTYVGTTLTRGGNVTAENLARMAQAMGYRLVLVKDGEEVAEVSPRD